MMRVSSIAGLAVLLFILLQLGCSSSRTGVDSPPDTFRCYYDARVQEIGRPVIVADFIQFMDSATPRLDLYLEVPHAHLHFTTDDRENLETEYNISISITDRRNNTLDRQELTRRVQTSRDQIARYGASDRTMQSFNLEPGEYRFIITILDRSVGSRAQIRETVEIKSMQPDPVAMSDLLLIRSIRTENNRRVITPMLADRVLALTEPFHVFTELYSNGDTEDVTLEYGLIRKYYNNDFLIDNPFSYRVQRQYHRTGISVEKRDTIVTSDTTVTLREGTNQLFIPFDHNIDRGSYRLFVRKVGAMDDEKEGQISAASEFLVHAIDFPHMTDVDQQIEALHYVASTRDLDRIKSGETREERRRLLNEYWQDVGAWKMSDYYERVRIANELFTTNVEGWKTPMGMVFIILGEPHMIDCRIGIERTETWTYYMQGGGIEFVFMRERTADPADRKAHYWVSSIRGGYSAWLSAVNMWR